MLRIIWIPALLVCAAGAHAQNISTIAGSTFVFPASPLPAIQAPLGQVWAVALDKAGNYYVADTSNSIVVKISASGTLTIVAGNGTFGYSGDGGPATSAALDYPYGIAVDGAGNLYIADTFSCVIRMVNTSGVITTVAGNYANAGYSGDGGQATNAGLSAPYGVAVDAAGNLYIADEGNNVIRKVDTDGIITTVAGNGTGGESGDGGPAIDAELCNPFGVAVDGSGNLFMAESCSRVRKVDQAGIIHTVAGNGQFTYNGDGIPATSAALAFPRAIALDSAGNLFIADTSNQRIRMVNSSGIISTVAGDGNPAGYSGDGGPATWAALNLPAGLAVDSAGNLLIADTYNNRVRKVAQGTIATVAGNGGYEFGGDGGPAPSALLDRPSAVAVDSAGNLFVVDGGNSRIRQIDTGGTITTVAGNGILTYAGDGGPATSASLDSPMGVAGVRHKSGDYARRASQ